MFRLSVIATISFVLAGAMSPAQATDLRGTGQSVVDGDEFVFCPGEICADSLAFNIRLCGIDTPSRGRPEHEKTVAALTELVSGKRIICTPVGEGTVCDGKTSATSRGRTVAQCYTEENRTDIAAQLVSAGLACDNAKRSGGHYSKDNPAFRCKQ